MEDEEFVLPIDGLLDLHAFRPDEAASAAEEYISACHAEGITEVKIIHGKGKGMLRRTIHSMLENHPLVQEFTLDPGPSGWGATIVILRKS